MPEPSYTDIERAVRTEKRQIWVAWFCGGVIWLIITNATKNIAVVSVITQVLLIVLGIASTFIAMKMSRALNRKGAAARRQVLGDD
jgi:ABC-type phosphate transport system auxiliary subunit